MSDERKRIEIAGIVVNTRRDVDGAIGETLATLAGGSQVGVLIGDHVIQVAAPRDWLDGPVYRARVRLIIELPEGE